MKIQFFIFLLAFCALASGVFVPPRPDHRTHLLGAKECTWGPSYWCQNLTSAGDCHAVKHCIQTVWIHKKLPPDTSSVCQTCLDMVKQARDQLESNETQELIKEVFEGSCALIHLKPIVKECDKIADQYIPELIDTLASQMNPQIVCSVAGLCNNQKVHQLLERENENELAKREIGTKCQGCYTVSGILRKRFEQMSRDEVLQKFLGLCGRTGSLSDGCSNIVITYFTEIYDHIKEDFQPQTFCVLSGECSALFHNHAEVEITPMSHVGYVSLNNKKDDLPCELCEQLIGHLRDLLVANTTESEFKQVLEGLCKQTKSFTNECLSLVDQYYAVAYNFLLNELNTNEACKLIGICPNGQAIESDVGPIVPLLPFKTASKYSEMLSSSPEKKTEIRVEISKPAPLEILNPETAQLPIDILVPPHTQVLYNTQICVFCEYFLHYIQQEITEPKNEEEIKIIIDKACSKLPKSVNETCVQFVALYEPALIAILAEEIDPSTVCPLIKACPAADVKDQIEIFMKQQGDGSKCPMCLFAVSKLEEMVKNQKTEEEIKDALTKLCSHLPGNLVEECNDFVNTYTNELVELLMADLTPQEVCVYLKLCTDNTPVGAAPNAIYRATSADTNTNQIFDDTVNGKLVNAEAEDQPQCVLCEFVMKQLEDVLQDNRTETEIKHAIHEVCNHMPSTISAQCNSFINQYGDTIFELLLAALEPSEICTMLKLCTASIAEVKAEIFDCAICESIVYAMEKMLENPKVDHNVEHVLEKTCRALPHKEEKKCKEIIDKYGKTIYNLIIHFANKGMVCREIGLCAQQVARPRRQLGANKCTQGPGYWCALRSNAEGCGKSAVDYCNKHGWNN